MPWVNPKVDLTFEEYEEFLDRCFNEGDEDLVDSDHVWISPGDMFDHTAGEILEMEAVDEANGELTGSILWHEG